MPEDKDYRDEEKKGDKRNTNDRESDRREQEDESKKQGQNER